MIRSHFHANMKVQTAMCKDDNNSRSRAATYVKFEINIKLYIYDMYMIYTNVHYIQCIKCPIFKISREFQSVKVHQS